MLTGGREGDIDSGKGFKGLRGIGSRVQAVGNREKSK
jgi:hypothetical protein